MATLNDNVFATHTAISLGRLRNGPASSVARTARESSISSRYYYNGIRYSNNLRGDPAAFAPACPTAVLLEAQYRSIFSRLVGAAVTDAEAAANAAAGAAGGAGGAPFDAAAARAAAEASPAIKLEAIALGAVRTSAVASYEIGTNDLRETEAVDPILQLNSPAPSTTRGAYAAAVRSATGGWTVSLASGHDDEEATAEEQTALAAPALSAEEVELAFSLLALGQASLVRAGAQLFIDGHHYHSDVNASARHRANEMEVTNRLSDGARNIWRANLMMLRNAIWHAAIHPIKEDVLQGLAEDPQMPERLDATGFGSFSVGLPAQEDLFNRGQSYLAVLNQVGQTATAHGHQITLNDLEQTMAALAGVGRGEPEAGGSRWPTHRPALPGLPSEPWPPGCDTRAKALKRYLEPALNRAEPVAAWLFGYYKEVCSRSGVRASSQEGSLLRSYSLKRAIGNYMGEANRAQEMYMARARFIRTQGEAGNLETYTGSA